VRQPATIAIVIRLPSVAVVALLVVLAPLHAPAESPRAEEIAQAVGRLGADDYRVREQATAWLWVAGPAVEEALKAGLKSADAEVVARCRDLLDKIPYGITPDMPPRFVALIGTARAGGAGGWPAVAPDLLDMGPRGLEVARKLIERIANNDAQRDAMRRTLDLEGWRVAPALLVAGRAEEAGQLLERSAVIAAAAGGDAPAARHYAAFVAVQGKLAVQAPRWQNYTATGDKSGDENGRLADGSPDARAARVVLVALARLRGDLAAARKAADASGRTDLQEAVMFDQGAWSDLANLPASPIQSVVLPHAFKLMCLAAAGRHGEAKAALDELRTMTPTRASGGAPPMLFRALMYAGHPADALAALERYKGIDGKGTDGLLPQFEVLAQLHRYAEAFAKLDRPVRDHEAIRWQWDTAKLRIYRLQGEREKFRHTLAELAAYENLSPEESTEALKTVEMLVSLDHTANAVSIAAAMLNGGTAPADVFGKLYPSASLAAEACWRYERLQHPNEPMKATLARLPARLDKRLDSADGRAALKDAAKIGRAQPDADADRWLRGLADACFSAGMGEQARALSREAAERTHSAAAWQQLGDLHSHAKQYAEAAAAYDRAWRADEKQPLPLWLRGWALEKAGQSGGPEARTLARTLPLGDEDIRYKFAEELGNRRAFGPELLAAARAERQLIVRLSGPGSNIGRNAQAALSRDRGLDPAEAADATQRFLFRLQRTGAYFFRNTDYLVMLHRLASLRAQELVAKGDAAGAVREAENALAILPGIDPAETLVPALDKAGRKAEADRVYTSTAMVCDRLCKDCPQSAEFRNQRAWFAARCRRDLEAATDLARNAVELEPEHANYHDTLAEVLFQRGDKDGALAEIKRCIELKPSERLYAARRARIEAGDRDAPLPEQ
jgi:tetratricopeptide (TPR) repeat protein